MSHCVGKTQAHCPPWPILGGASQHSHSVHARAYTPRHSTPPLPGTRAPFGTRAPPPRRRRTLCTLAPRPTGARHVHHAQGDLRPPRGRAAVHVGAAAHLQGDRPSRQPSSPPVEVTLSVVHVACTGWARSQSAECRECHTSAAAAHACPTAAPCLRHLALLALPALAHCARDPCVCADRRRQSFSLPRFLFAARACKSSARPPLVVAPHSPLSLLVYYFPRHTWHLGCSPHTHTHI